MREVEREEPNIERGREQMLEREAEIDAGQRGRVHRKQIAKREGG